MFKRVREVRECCPHVNVCGSGWRTLERQAWGGWERL